MMTSVLEIHMCVCTTSIFNIDYRIICGVNMYCIPHKFRLFADESFNFKSFDFQQSIVFE